VFLVGLLNTLLVSIIGIFFATVIGFLVALGRLSPNWRRASPAAMSNWYAICHRCSRSCSGISRARRAAKPAAKHFVIWQLLSFQPGSRGSEGDRPRRPGAVRAGILVAIVASLLLQRYARRQLFESGRLVKIWPYVVGLLIGLPLLTRFCSGAPVTFEMPELKGFNFSGGSRIIPEFVALTVALSTYTAAFIAEIVRAGIQSVHKGRWRPGSSLGLQRGSVLRLIVVPQAMRVILPPLTNQYLNLTKNSSLAVAIGYPDLFSYLRARR